MILAKISVNVMRCLNVTLPSGFWQVRLFARLTVCWAFRLKNHCKPGNYFSDYFYGYFSAIRQWLTGLTFVNRSDAG